MDANFATVAATAPYPPPTPETLSAQQSDEALDTNVAPVGSLIA